MKSIFYLFLLSIIAAQEITLVHQLESPQGIDNDITVIAKDFYYTKSAYYELIYLLESDKIYRIDHKNKTLVTVDEAKFINQSKSMMPKRIKPTKSKQQKQFQGLESQHYTISAKSAYMKIDGDVYFAEIDAVDMKKFKAIISLLRRANPVLSIEHLNPSSVITEMNMMMSFQSGDYQTNYRLKSIDYKNTLVDNTERISAYTIKPTK